MEHETVDRRVRKTRQLLTEALIHLVIEKGYDRVTVQDIIDRADIGRSTFYAHYRDKEDLLLSGFDELRPAFETSGGDGDPSTEIFRHASEHAPVYRAIVGRRAAQVVVGHFHRMLAELYMKRLRDRVDPARDPAVPLDGVVEYLVSALIGIVQWGIDRDDPATPEQLQAWFQTLVTPGVRKALGVTP